MAQGGGKPCQGSLRSRSPPGRLGQLGSSARGGGGWRAGIAASSMGKRPPGNHRRGERGARLVLSSSLGFVLILVAAKPGDTHPRRGCQAALAQVRLRWEPDRRLALHGSQEIAAIDSNREAAAGSVFTATNRACSAVSRQERHPARLGSCWQPLPLFELMG